MSATSEFGYKYSLSFTQEKVPLLGNRWEGLSFYNDLLSQVLHRDNITGATYEAIQNGAFGIIYRVKDASSDLVYHLSLRSAEEPQYSEYNVARENHERLVEAWKSIKSDPKLEKMCLGYDFFPAQVVQGGDIPFRGKTYYYYATEYLPDFAELGILTDKRCICPNIFIFLPPLDRYRESMLDSMLSGYGIYGKDIINYSKNINRGAIYPWNTKKIRQDEFKNYANQQELQLVRYYYLVWKIFGESLPSRFLINAGDLMAKCPMSNEENAGILNGARLIALQGEKVEYDINELVKYLNEAQILGHSANLGHKSKLFFLLTEEQIRGVIEQMEQEYNQG